MTARFRFGLQRLLDLRERRERDAAIALAAARTREDEIRAQCDSTAARRDDARARMLPPVGTQRSVRDLYMAALVVEQLDGTASSLANALRQAASESARSQGSLADRVRDRRALERLRDRHQQEWNVEAAQHERETMDGIAQRSVSALSLTSSTNS